MSDGRFGIHGGQYIPETLMNAVKELEEAYNHYKNDPEFNRELTELLNDYAGRPSRLYYAEKMTKDLGGAKIYLKREDLNHTGAHKINNVLGQALLAKKMGKTRLIAETGAGQHGVATATAAAAGSSPVSRLHFGALARAISVRLRRVKVVVFSKMQSMASSGFGSTIGERLPHHPMREPDVQ